VDGQPLKKNMQGTVTKRLSKQLIAGQQTVYRLIADR